MPYLFLTERFCSDTNLVSA